MQTEARREEKMRLINSIMQSGETPKIPSDCMFAWGIENKVVTEEEINDVISSSNDMEKFELALKIGGKFMAITLGNLAEAILEENFDES